MLQLLSLSKIFGKLIAVSNVKINVEKGKIVGLIGPNGSGKTTMFNLITGFLKPTSGEILWEGENIEGRPPHVIARKGIVRTFQITSLYAELTSLQNIIMASHLEVSMNLFEQFIGSKRAREKEKAIEEKAISFLELMGIQSEKDRIAGDLPGGTQRILSIAMAIACGPKLLMLDEPIAGLNSPEKVMVMDRIKILRNMGITIFIIEHDMKAIMAVCDRINVIDFGVKIAEGTPEEISIDKRTITAYLGKESHDLV